MHTRLVAGIIAAFAVSSAVVSGEQQRQHFELPPKDLAKAEELANQLARLSRRVDPDEARLFAEYAYATVARLRQEYRPFGTPIFNNFLVYHGWRKRGYCFQWTEDLLLALDTLKLKTLELHWGDTYRDTWRENNCLVVTAKGQPFERGMILECWRHFGHLRWNLVPSDQDPYYENTKWAEKVRARAASRTFGPANVMSSSRRKSKEPERPPNSPPPRPKRETCAFPCSFAVTERIGRFRCWR